MYAVQVIQGVYGQLNGGPIGSQLERRIQLPFVPVPGMGLGLRPGCHFGDDELCITRVMWICHAEEFLVYAEPVRLKDSDPTSVIRSMLSEGWRLHDSIALSGESAIREVRCGGYAAAVLMRGGYHVLNDFDFQVLKLSGEPFEAVATGSANDGGA